MEKSLVALTVLTLVCLVPARAQNSAACTPASLRGTYSVTCSGVSSPAPGAPQMPFSGLGIIKYDWGGNYSASFKVSLGGTTVDYTGTGVTVVNSDCTGTNVFDAKVNGQPAGKINYIFHILDDGKEQRITSPDPGNNVICEAKLMSRQ